MSKIFDVLKKDNLVDFGDLCLDDVHPVSEAARAPELPGSATEKCVIEECLIPERSGAERTGPEHSGDANSSRARDRLVRLRLSTFSPVFPFDKGDDTAAEQYRMVRTKILHSPKKPRLIVVSSACSGDGKTVTSINIAASLALKDQASVLLVDGDLRQPRVAEALGIPPSPGLAEILSSGTDLDAALIRPEQFPNLFILPAGNAGTSAAELLDSERWRAFIKQIRGRFAHVIFDAPPLALLTDYDLIQLACDAAVLVARPGHSNRAAFLKALEAVSPEKMLGVVLNCVENWWLWKTPAYGYYYRRSDGRP
jgi:receptor protein-tyrosine kinase